MTLVAPQALLLLLPLGLFLYFTARIHGPPMWLRVALVTFLVIALARPEFRLRSAGSDVVVVVDRSRSMPPRGEASAEELIRLLEPQRRPGDRLGVISFGRDPRIEMPLSSDGHFPGFNAAIDGEASNLSAALDANLAMISVSQNEISKRLASYGAIVAVPTMIAGIYGMNFVNMPELKVVWGYPAVLSLIMVVCAVLFWRFKKSGWLYNKQLPARQIKQFLK